MHTGEHKSYSWNEAARESNIGDVAKCKKIPFLNGKRDDLITSFLLLVDFNIFTTFGPFEFWVKNLFTLLLSYL